MQMTSKQVVTIVGFSSVSFTDQDGKNISGTKIWWTEPPEAPSDGAASRIVGLVTGSAYINTPLTFTVGKEYRLVYQASTFQGQQRLKVVGVIPK